MTVPFSIIHIFAWSKNTQNKTQILWSENNIVNFQSSTNTTLPGSFKQDATPYPHKIVSALCKVGGEKVYSMLC